MRGGTLGLRVAASSKRADRPRDRDHVAQAELRGRVAQRRFEQRFDDPGPAPAELGGDVVQDRQRVRFERQVEERHEDRVGGRLVGLVDEVGELLGGVLPALGIGLFQRVGVGVDKLAGYSDVCVHDAMLATRRPGVTAWARQISDSRGAPAVGTSTGSSPISNR